MVEHPGQVGKANQYMSRQDVISMTNRLWTSFEERLDTGRLTELVNAVPGAHDVLDRYEFAFRHILLNTHSAMLAASYTKTSTMGAIASNTESVFLDAFSEFADAVESAAKKKTIGDLDAKGYAALKEAAGAYFEVMEVAESFKPKAVGKGVEPESITTYLDRIFAEYEKYPVHE